MRLKEIKPGMVIHCKTNEEKMALLQEAEVLGYKWSNHCVPTNCHMIEGSGMTIHFYEKSELTDFKHITWSDKTEGVTEFSDLILPELTTEEVLSTISEMCKNTQCKDCYLGKYCDKTKGLYSLNNMEPKVIIDACEKWKSDHERKEPQIETVDICRIIEIQPDGRKRCVHEEDIKPDPELPYGSEEIAVHEILKRYCMEHDGEFIAVHEVVTRVKK